MPTTAATPPLRWLALAFALAAGACYDNSPVPTQQVAGPYVPPPPPPPVVPSADPPVDPYNPLVSSPFIVDSGATPGGRLAFTYSDDFWDGDVRVFSMRPDGSEFVQVTPSDVTYAWSPTWSPDDAMIAYASYKKDGSSQVWVVRPDGTGRSPVTDGDYPFWLADGRIGYTCSYTDICAVDASGVNPAVLLHRTSSLPEYGFTLSPDGAMIAFVRIVDNETHTNGPIAPYNVWVMRRDGSDLHRITTTDSASTIEFAPSWSRDGKQIAFRSAQYGIAVADADGGRLHSVSHEGDIRPSIGRGSPAWSPDGKQIVFGGERGTFFFANADGTGLIRRVTVPMPAGYSAGDLSWSKR